MRPLHLSVEEAGRVLGLDRNGAYRAAQAGELPTIHLRTKRVPLVKLEETFGPISDERLAAARVS